MGSAAGWGRVAPCALCQLDQAQAGVDPALQEPGCDGTLRPNCCLRRPCNREELSLQKTSLKSWSHTSKHLSGSGV